MGTGTAEAENGGERHYLVDCEDCSFERTVSGRDSAMYVGGTHSAGTRHEITVIELPENMFASTASGSSGSRELNSNSA